MAENIRDFTVPMKKAASILEFAMRTNQQVMLVGAPGIGKTEIILEAAKKAEREVIICHPVVDDETDYKGLPFKVGDHAEFLAFDFLESLIKAEKPTLVLIDDFGQGRPGVQAAMMQLLLAREINGKKISPNILFMAATNRREDKAGVSGILEPVKSRFQLILNLETTAKDWISWALNHNMPPELIGFATQFQSDVFNWQPNPNDITGSSCPRTLAHLGRMINAGLPKDIEFECFVGAVGPGTATQFVGYLKYYREIPTYEEILKNPETAKIGSDAKKDKEQADVHFLYGVCGMIPANYQPKHAAKIMKYIKRLPEEYQVYLMKNIKLKNESYFDSPELDKWLGEHIHLMED